MVEPLALGVTECILEAPWSEADVRVCKQEPLTSGLLAAEIERVVFAHPALGQPLDPEHPHPVRPHGREPGEDVTGVVGRAVVHGHDFEGSWVVLSEDGSEPQQARQGRTGLPAPGPRGHDGDLSSSDDGVRSLDAARGSGPLLEDGARDDEALYLAGALVDLRHPRIPVVALDGMVLHVSVTA